MVEPPVVLVVMGVSGCGKSTVAAELASRLGWELEEGDSLHPEANRAKMAAGRPLTDEDRWPWLERVAEWAEARLDAGRSGVVTCSALKRSYRQLIARRGEGIVFVHLTGSREVLSERLAARHGHFMPRALLDSQLETLEPLGDDEPHVTLDIGPPAAVLAERVVTELRLRPAG
jgi:gluconokinase